MKLANGISIITVVYNAALPLEETIKSVIKERNLVDEFIIIDGGSTDGTVEVLKTYEQHITSWISEPDNGIYDAMNKGWSKASNTNHILYLGAGDTLISLPKPSDLNTEIVYYGNVVMGDGSIFKGKADIRLKIGNTLHHQALLIPKKINIDPPFDPVYKVYGDFDFNQRLYKAGRQFKRNTDIKSYMMPDGVSQDNKTMEWYYIIKRNYGLMVAVLGFIYYHFQRLKRY